MKKNILTLCRLLYIWKPAWKVAWVRFSYERIIYIFGSWCVKCISVVFLLQKIKVDYVPVPRVRCSSVSSESNDCGIMRRNHCGATQLVKSSNLICYLGERKEIDFGGELADFMIPIMFIGGPKKLKLHRTTLSSQPQNPLLQHKMDFISFCLWQLIKQKNNNELDPHYKWESLYL